MLQRVSGFKHTALALSLALQLFPTVRASDPAQQARHEREPKNLDAIEVHATPLPDTAERLTTPVEVLAGNTLEDAKAGTLGETVAGLPGVQASHFGPGVSRPIIRGLDGARVQVLSDGLGSGDVSTVSVDHAVSIEPFLADQIEVLKGPATLLYGSGAIGGAVNVVDGRIPVTRAATPLAGRMELRHDSVSHANVGMLRLDGGSGDIAFHFDALHREAGDYRIPGFAESADHLAEQDELPTSDASGRLTNSGVRTHGAALGLSWIGSRGFIGAAYSLYGTRYGIPGGHAHAGDHAHDHDAGGDHDHDVDSPVRVVMDQRRSELRGGLDAIGPLASLRLKVADTDYTHTEFEGDAIGTVFTNRSREARMELVHQPLAGWEGAFGLQASQRRFTAAGAEAFVPGSTANDSGLFWIGKRNAGPLHLDLGLRHDRSRIDVAAAAQAVPDRDFHTSSLSGGLAWKLSDTLHLNLGVDRAQRAPSAEELYSSGLHVATGSLEFGDQALRTETARRVELGLHLHRGPLTLQLSAWQARYDDFIYLASTDRVVDGAPIRLWRQDAARLQGAEAKLDWELADNRSGVWSLSLFTDSVRGRLVAAAGTLQSVELEVPHGDHSHSETIQVASGGNLPRIVPARTGARLRWERNGWRASLGAIRHASQHRVAAFEQASAGFTLIDAHLAWHLDSPNGHEWELFFDASNLSNREARPHTSFLKDLVPLPGRNLALGVRLYF